MSADGVTQKSRRGFPQSFFVYLSGKRTGLKMQMFYSLEELIFISALIFCAVMSRAGRQIFRTCNPDSGYQILRPCGKFVKTGREPANVEPAYSVKHHNCINIM